MKKLIIVLLAYLLASCANLDGNPPSTFSKPQKTTSFTLAADAIGDMTSTNSFGIPTVYKTGLRAGKYVSVFSDADGTYYQGNKDCLYNSIAFYKDLDGGIWIPNKGSGQEPRFWFYLKRMKPGEFNSGIIGAALANIHAGNVRKELSTRIEPFLLERISVQDEP